MMINIMLLMKKMLTCTDFLSSFKHPPKRKHLRENFLLTSAEVNAIGVRCSFDDGRLLEDQITLAIRLKHF